MRRERGKMLTYSWDRFQTNMMESLHKMVAADNGTANVILMAEDGKLRAHQFVLSAASKYFRDIFTDMSHWQQPVVVLKTISISTLELIVEFMYKGSVRMKEDVIEQFIEAGKLLEIEGVVGDTEEVQLLDGDDVDDVPAARRQILNSTASCDNIHDVEDEVEHLRDADNLRSFNLDLSEIHSRDTSLTRELSVNIRRLSKDDSRVMAVMEQSLNLSSGRRSSRLSRSQVNYCEDEQMNPHQTLNKTSSINLSQNSSRRSSKDKVTEELVILDDDDISMQNFSLRSQSNGSRISSNNSDPLENSSVSESLRESSRRRSRQDCHQCDESIAVAEMDNHLRTFHRRRSRQSVSSASAPSREKSLINLGSLYRTKPMESSRSIALKSASRSRLQGIASQKTKSMSLFKKPDRAQMLRSLETRQETASLPETAEPSTQPEVSFNITTTQPQLLVNETTTTTQPHLDEATVTASPVVCSQDSGDVIDNDPIDTNVVLSADGDETRQHMDVENVLSGVDDRYESNELQALPVEQQNATNTLEESKFAQPTIVDVSSNLVIIGDRRMCKICGLQVFDSNPDMHFLTRHNARC